MWCADVHIVFLYHMQMACLCRYSVAEVVRYLCLLLLPEHDRSVSSQGDGGGVQHRRGAPDRQNSPRNDQRALEVRREQSTPISRAAYHMISVHKSTVYGLRKCNFLVVIWRRCQYLRYGTG
jgi:hypothetical protein